MVNYLKKLLLLFFMTLVVVSCQQEDASLDVSQEQQAIEQPNLEKDFSCRYGYVDGNWSRTAFRNSYIINSAQRGFIFRQNALIANVFGIPRVPLSFIHDNVNPSSTYNAISYSTGKIYFGEAIYRDALSKGQIVPAMILAHEIGHQLQYRYNLPSRQERTARATELEADGYAGYYMRKPNGYNASWSQAGPAFAFAFQIGDYATSSPGHHGTPPQRRSATRLGWYLGAYNLNPRSFDGNFFYYYNRYVLPGSLKVTSDTEVPKFVNPEIDAFIKSKLDELIKLNKGELTEEDFINLD